MLFVCLYLYACTVESSMYIFYTANHPLWQIFECVFVYSLGFVCVGVDTCIIKKAFCVFKIEKKRGLRPDVDVVH